MSDMTTVLREHPLVIGGAVVAVALIAYMSKGNGGGGQVDYTFAGGGHAAPVDPQAAAISEAAINAGVSNLGAIAQLVGQQDSNSTALSASLAQTEASRQAALASTEAGRQTGLAGIAASLRASLFETEASRDVAEGQTAAGVTIAEDNNATATEAARITAATTAQQIQATLTAAQLSAQNQQFAIQADKDKARAQANTSIFSDILHVGASLLALL